MRHNHRGFTLIELLLVIAIICLILMLTVPSLVSVRRKALILGCQSNMHQINLILATYRVHNDEIIPYLFYASEGMLDPVHMQDPATKISGLAKIVGEDRGILRCPADTGYDGVDYQLTPDGASCYACFGQSYTYNNAFYTDPPAEYEPGQPVRYSQVEEPDSIVMLSDFSSAWHGAAASSNKGMKYFLNILFFDGHVEGKEFLSDLEAKEYRDRNSRWWEE